MKNLKTILFFTCLYSSFFLFSRCQQQQQTDQKSDNSDSSKFQVHHPEWSKNAIIYEVNLRQYTKSGTIKEFEKDLPRLKELGVDILWFMPINPIGKKNRKGKLGSYYSVSDYKAINPEFGSLEDFKEMVKDAHDKGMHVIIDWVANHTAWDNIWTKTHPEFYTKDKKGKFVPPNGTDWSDVIDLNYDNKELWTEMIQSLKFWIDSTNIDGFRCDVADWVPIEFWNRARTELDKIKPIFMLAEAEKPALHYKAFDASYAWEFHHIMHKIAKGEKDVSAIDSFYTRDTASYPLNAIRMQFITNHDENSWNGTVKEKFENASNAFAVLTYTFPGMPLIYSGQESGLDKRLKFFEKDPIDWGKDKYLPDFYKKLNNLKKQNSALWNGDDGASLIRLQTNDNSKIYAFFRENSVNTVLVILNLSKNMVKLRITSNFNFTGMKSYFSNETYENNEISLKPWEFRVYVK